MNSSNNEDILRRYLNTDYYLPSEHAEEQYNFNCQDYQGHHQNGYEPAFEPYDDALADLFPEVASYRPCKASGMSGLTRGPSQCNMYVNDIDELCNMLDWSRGIQPSPMPNNQRVPSQQNLRSVRAVPDRRPRVKTPPPQSPHLYACIEPTCNMKFDSFNSLKSHYPAHRPLAAKPFVCEHCGFAFARKHDMNRHVLSHFGLKLHVCQPCNKAFSRRDALVRHQCSKACINYVRY